MNAMHDIPQVSLDIGKVLIVDDERDNRQLLEGYLSSEGYEVLQAADGSAALEQVERGDVDIVLLDVMMPGLDGIEVCRRIRQMNLPAYVPVVIVTALSDRSTRIKGKSVGCDDFLLKPIDFEELSMRLQNLMLIKNYYDHVSHQNDSLEQRVHERTADLRKANQRLEEAEREALLAQNEIIDRLSRAAEFRDDDTHNHIERMSRYCALIARALGFDDKRCEEIREAAKLHDIGKIGIPDRILRKPGRLSPDEFEVIKEHSDIGHRILEGSQSRLLQLAAKIAHTHHERFDGSGYPRGLKNGDIPVEGRICALADVFDAMTSMRVYKDAMPVEEALGYIREGRGSHFDPELVDLFLDIIDEVLVIKKQHADE